MATADYWSSADLKGLPFGGYINEDVMQQIIDISRIPLVMTDMIGSDSVSNSYTEWPKDKLSDVDLSNAVVDGDDAATYDNVGGTRVGNQCQISRKVIAVTTRARQSDTIGTSDEYSKQLMRRTQELRRDVEAVTCTNQTSQADDGATAPGLIGGLNSWLVTNTNRGATGADGGFASGTVTGATLGTVRALSETMIRDVCQSTYQQGGNPTVATSRPDVIRRISEYMFGDTARIGIQQTETGKSGASTAVGSVKVFITDFDVELMLRANRLQPYMDAGAGDTNDSLFILDPEYLRHGYLHNYRTEPLAKVGLSDRAQVAVDWTLKVLAEEAQGVVADIDATAAMVA
jgi:hypothetical protein